MKKLYGMVAVMPTPFNADESINFEGIKTLVAYLNEGGIHGILVCGSGGEYTLMSMDERKAVIKASVEANKGEEAFIVAGCSCHRTVDTIEMVKYAGEVGADFALVLPPYYMTTDDKGIIEYYKEVSEASKIGVVIYHYPSATGVTLSADLIAKIAELPNIVGIKDSARMEHTFSVITKLGDNPNFSIMHGFEDDIINVLASGGDGTMGLAQSLAPKQMRAIFDAMQKNDYQTALAINKKLAPLYCALEEEPAPGPLKAGCNILGLPGGIPRKPIPVASDKLTTKIKAAMKEAGIF